MSAFVLNLLFAAVWLLLASEPSTVVFGVGFLFGFGLLAAFRSLLGAANYVRRCFGFIRFVLVFGREFVVANLKVAWMVLFCSNESLHPNFVTLDVAGLTRPEILLLSYCISLTPGTTSVDICEDFRTLVVHALEASDPAAVRREINDSLKRSILGFTR